MLGQAFCQDSQALFCPSRKQDQFRLREWMGGSGGLYRRSDEFFDHHVNILAGEAVRTDPGTARNFIAPVVLQTGPRQIPIDHEKRSSLKLDLRVALSEVKVARDDSVTHRQHDLDYTCETRHSLQVTNIGLDRTQAAVAGASDCAIRIFESSPKTLNLYWITELGAGTVSLNVGHRFRTNASPP